MKPFLSLCPLPLFLNFTSTQSHLFELGVLSSFYTPGDLTCEGKSHILLAVVAALPDLCKTIKGYIQASGFLFWAKVQLSL